MKTDFILDIRRSFGQDEYAGVRKELASYKGTSTCAFYENAGALMIQVDPYVNNTVLKKSSDELKIVLSIALKYYSQLGMVFDDITFVLEFLSTLDSELKNIANDFFHQQTLGVLKKKYEIPLYGDKEFLISYLSTTYKDYIIEVQNIENAYGILTIRKS